MRVQAVVRLGQVPAVVRLDNLLCFSFHTEAPNVRKKMSQNIAEHRQKDR